MDGINRSCGWDKQVMWMGKAGHVDWISRSHGSDKQVILM